MDNVCHILKQKRRQPKQEEMNFADVSLWNEVEEYTKYKSKNATMCSKIWSTGEIANEKAKKQHCSSGKHMCKLCTGETKIHLERNLKKLS